MRGWRRATGRIAAITLMAAFSAECAVTHMAWFPRERQRYGPDLRFKLDEAQEVSAVRWQRGLPNLSGRNPV